TYFQRSWETKLALRRQLNDILQKLTDLNTETSKYRALVNTPRGAEYPPNYLSLVNDQRRFLVRQAAFIVQRVSRMVSPYEYLVIAGAFDGIDDTYEAEAFFEQAVRKAANRIERGIAIRARGRYFFARGHLPEAREQYRAAIEVFNGTSDYHI